MQNIHFLISYEWQELLYTVKLPNLTRLQSKSNRIEAFDRTELELMSLFCFAIHWIYGLSGKVASSIRFKKITKKLKKFESNQNQSNRISNPSSR